MDKNFVTKRLAYLKISSSSNKAAKIDEEKLIHSPLQSLQDKVKTLKAQADRVARSGAVLYAQLDKLQDDQQLS
ncbi:hypothetical protein [Bartonella rattimassiliensis]|uniref:hypothetical protein n=1 Tax=Bartonella rattimassiliensis TaxID=270250 RepID=UPI0002D9E1C8|nr:hypothetical protein [Bartonella rattimassiliensis]